MARDAVSEPERSDDEHRSARKRRAIIEAATTVFLQKGYLGTSMEEIAALAAVSKQTLYKQFADKERLFTEIILGTIDQAGQPLFTELAGLAAADDLDLEHDLRTLARQLVTTVMQPDVLRLRRLIIAEAVRFPELGRAYFERGPGRTVAALAPLLEALADRGLLRVDDAVTAAQHFLWLAISVPINEAMLRGSDDASPAELERHADAGLGAFLAAYSVPR